MSFPPPVRSELEGLTAFLAEQRAAVRRKVEDLTEEQARATPTVSSMSLLAIVKHLGFAERRWFHVGVAGRDLPGAWPVEDWQAEWRLGPEDDVGSVLAFYDAMAAESDAIVAAAGSPDAVCRHPDVAQRNLRWVVLHVVEDTARHAGQADVIRETIDGATGA